MTNASKLITLIKEENNLELNNEIEYHMILDRDYEYDAADGFDDTHTFAEENKERGLLKVCRSILIKAGLCYKEPEKTDVGRDTRFTLDGEKYQYLSWEVWIND